MISTAILVMHLSRPYSSVGQDGATVYQECLLVVGSCHLVEMMAPSFVKAHMTRPDITANMASNIAVQCLQIVQESMYV